MNTGHNILEVLSGVEIKGCCGCNGRPERREVVSAKCMLTYRESILGSRLASVKGPEAGACLP